MSIASDMGAKPSPALRFRAGRRLVILSSLCMVVLAAIAALFLLQGIDRQLRDVVDTYEVRNHASELMIALSDAESSQRGYLLTGDTVYIEPFQRAAASINTRLLSLIDQTRDDPTQAERVASVADDVRAIAASLESLVVREEDAQMPPADALERLSRQPALDEVRTTLTRFVAEENQKLSVRNASIDQSRRWLVAALLAALLGAVVLGYSLLIRTQRQVSALSRRSDQLSSANEVLEQHVQERTRDLEDARAHAERERQRVEALLQDTNHRIGNSLATVSSLLGLQMIRSKSEEVKNALEAARSRVHAIAAAHRRLRLGSDFETSSADEFLGAVIDDIQHTAPDSSRISIEKTIAPVVMSARDATTLGILVGELMTNALKHGFGDGRKGHIIIALTVNDGGTPTLTVEDNGVGLADFDPESAGLGSVIVKQLSGQFGGSPVYDQSRLGGLRVAIGLPNIDAGAVRPLMES